MEAKTAQVATAQANQPMTIKSIFNKDDVKNKFQEMLGKKAQGFITSVLQICNSNDLLAKADPMSIYNAAATAATMDLAINQNLGHSYIMPFNDRKSGKCLAQFVLGWKGYVQLAQRTGQFKTIHTTEVYENQIESVNYLTGEVTFKQDAPSGKVVGFIAYFKLTNGFEKSFYMNHEQMKQHALKYSQSYKKGYGVWADGEDGFNAMGKKTVLKLLLQRYAPLSIEMQKAINTDQAVINDEDATDVTYVDNQAESNVSSVIGEAAIEEAQVISEPAKSETKKDKLF